jgi:hypothetical protein
VKFFIGLLAIIAAVLLAPLLMPNKQGPAAPAAHGMPWQIELPAPGQSRVLGLVLGNSPALPASTLADARQLSSEPPKLALVAPKDGPLSLEAYFEMLNLGTLSGKLLLTVDAPPAELEAMRERAAKSEYMSTGTKQYLLNAADNTRAHALPLRAIAFIPSASLDEAIILQRFGTPAERIRQGETLEHFLYPEKGLDLVLDSKGKEVLQYVAPAQFARLREPLTAK